MLGSDRLTTAGIPARVCAKFFFFARNRLKAMQVRQSTATLQADEAKTIYAALIGALLPLRMDS
jgi:hypothetical protein